MVVMFVVVEGFMIQVKLLMMENFYWTYLGSVLQAIIVMIIKHHTYTLHIRPYKHTENFQRLPVNKM